MRIPDTVISDLVSKLDIVQYIGKYVSLEKRGQNHFGCCPFHEENTPSFSVSELKHIYHCFGCGEGGGIIQFAMQYHKLSFIDAVFLLADEIGYDLSAYKQAQFTKKKSPVEVLYHDTFAETQKLYTYLLTTTSGKEAKAYLEARHLNDDLQKQFGIGFAPVTSVLKTHFEAKKIPLDAAYTGSLIRDGENNTYDFFRNRITFPIADSDGNIVAYTARKLATDTNPESPKYLNSPETPFFKKGELLYNAYQAQSHIKAEKQVYIFEGITDVIAAYRNDIKNAVAVLGTALTDVHAKMLSRFKAKVVLCFDGDNAGINAAIKSGDILLKYQIQSTVLQLPNGQDPDNYFMEHSKVDFQLLQNSAHDFVTYKAYKRKEAYTLTQLSEQNAYLDELFISIRNYTSPSDQQYFLEQIATISEIDLQRVVSRFHENQQQYTERPVPVEHQSRQIQVQQYAELEEKVLKVLLENKELFDYFKQNQGYFTQPVFQMAYHAILEYRFQFQSVDEIELSHFFNHAEIRKEVQQTIMHSMMRTVIDLNSESDYKNLMNRYFEKLKRDNFLEQKKYNLQKEAISMEQLQKLIQLKKDAIKK